MPAGKRLAPMLGELVPVLRHFGELVIDEDTAALLLSMSADSNFWAGRDTQGGLW
jgi:hypothetical protein